MGAAVGGLHRPRSSPPRARLLRGRSGLRTARGAFVGSVAGGVGNGDDFLVTLGQWALGDATGATLVGVAVLAVGSSPDRRRLTVLNAAALVGATTVASVAAFSLGELSLGFLVLAVTVVCGAAIGTRAVALSALTIAVTFMVHLSIEPPTLSEGTGSASLMALKAQILVFTFTGLLVAAENFELAWSTRRTERLEAQAAIARSEASSAATVQAVMARSLVEVAEREEQLRALFSSIDEGFALCELVRDVDGRAVDYRFLDVNPLFEEMTGLRDPVGRTALELVPASRPTGWTCTPVSHSGARRRASSSARPSWADSSTSSPCH